MKLFRNILLATFLITLPLYAVAQNGNWTGTWAAAPEYAGKSDLPSVSLADHSLREIIKVSTGGNSIRLKMSNEFSRQDVSIRSVYIAEAGDSSEIVRGSARYITFNNKRKVTIGAGKALYSDRIKYNLKPLSRISITINYAEKVPVNITSHRGSRTTSYIAAGEVSPGKKFISVEKLDHWYTIASLEVSGQTNVDAVAVLGNSITDGRGSTTNMQNRWPDFMSEAFGGKKAVLNLGIGGNCVVRGGISEPGLKRFDRDILGQKGVDKLIIFEGTNDIGISKGNSEFVADTLIGAYKVLIAKAKKAGMKVYGATITPFKGNNWFSYFHEAARQTVNEWIRTSGYFDEVIDFDQLVRDPQNPHKLKKEYSDDWLHLNPAGYKAMGEYAAGIIK